MLRRLVVAAGSTFAASLFLAGTAPAQTGVLSGAVFAGESRSGLAGATVTIVGTKLSAVTGKDGRFTIANVPAGDQTLTVRRFEFAPREDRIRVAAGDTTHAYYELINPAAEREAKSRAVMVEGMEVPAGEKRRVIMVDDGELTAGEAKKRVMLVDGVEVSGADVMKGTISIRKPVEGGATPLIIIDGVIMPPDFLLEALDAGRIDRVEVVKGTAATSLYGKRATDGAIHITTKTRPPLH